MTTPAFHHAQIARAFPDWSRHLHPVDASRLIAAARAPYLDEQGAPFSWYAVADEMDRQSLSEACRARDASARALAEALRDKRDPIGFCTPLLQEALGVDVPVETAQYVFQPFKVEQNWTLEPIDPSVLPAGDPLAPATTVTADGPAQATSLLAAALRNFKGLEAVGPLSTVRRGPQDDTPLPGLGVDRFVKVCRRLDLGRRYQDHLAALYHGAQATAIEHAWIQASLDQLRLDTHVAALSGLISQAARRTLLDWCDQVPCVTYAGRPLTCQRLELFGIALHDVLIISTEAPDRVNPCLLHMPGHPSQPLREFESTRALGKQLAFGLQRGSHRRHMLGNALLTQQPALDAHLQAALFERREHLGDEVSVPVSSPKIRAEPRPLPATPWRELYKAHVRRLKADAAYVVVPTARVDAEARLTLLEHWLARGLDALNVAAMLIPGLGQVMLVVSAAHVLDGIFHGIEAWEDGQRAEALGQVGSLLLDTLSAGALAGASLAVKASGFIDAMESVFVDRQARLWHPDLGVYRSDVAIPPDTLPNALGQYVLDERHYVRLDQGWFEQTLDTDGRWRLRHPSDPNAYAPAFVHDGASGWRLTHETPLDWDLLTLARRLGPAAQALQEADVLAALSASATDDALLRHCHVASEPPPVLLTDAFVRLGVDDEVEDAIDRVREGLPLPAYKNLAVAALAQLPGWPEDHVLEVFTGSERWGTSVRYGRTPRPGDVIVKMSRDELANGDLAKVVIEQIDAETLAAVLPPGAALEQPVPALQQVLADALGSQREALFARFHEARQVAPSANARTLGRHFTGLPNNALNALLDAASQTERRQLEAGRVPLRVAEEARRLQARCRLERALLGLHRPSLATADTQTLLAALRKAEPELPAEQLFAAACRRRDWAARTLGQQPVKPGFRSPLRLSDGRLGYPLSGRPRRLPWLRSAQTRLQDLYPSLTAAERAHVLSQLRARGPLADQLVALQHEQDALALSLLRWTEAVDGDERQERRLLSRGLNRAWRREGGADLAFSNLSLNELPSLPARFDHVRSLSLPGLNLRSMPGDFLQSFPRLERLHVAFDHGLDAQTLFHALRSAPQLRALSLVDLNLEHVSAHAEAVLTSMRSLTELSLQRNLLVLTESNWRTLARLPLTSLNLRMNRITLTPTLAQVIGEMVNLQVLDLSINPLQVAPALDGLTRLHTLHLHDCQLSTWPEALSRLMQRPTPALRRLELSGNHITQVPGLEAVLDSSYLRELNGSPIERYWRFNFNDLEQQTARQLAAAGVSVFEHEMIAEPARHVDWLDDADDAQRQVWHGLFGEGAHRELRDVIERVGRSAQARDNLGTLRPQVWALLERAAQDTVLRERLNEIAGDFPATCGDAGADAFSALQIETMAHDESATSELPGPYLFNVYRRLFRRDQVNVLAARLHAARLERQAALIARAQGQADDGALPPLNPLDDIRDDQLLYGGVDDIEIRLALRQALAEALAFPEPSQDMLYRETAQVSLTTQFNVEEAVRASDADAQARRRWIAAQPAWQRFLRRREARRFDEVDARWYDALDYLVSCLDTDSPLVETLDASVVNVLRDTLPSSPLDEAGHPRRLPLTDHLYRQAVERVSAARQAAVDALIAQLTAEQDPNP
ncbi:hypothetical protein G7007_00420 [Pseudomonas entomophila]|uniref:NEL-type E3 ubiquitin ligase domain-containing protein n=1 Tax=Pseudomonas entomophila TaxID=312306 RepID=UPI0015E2EC21|nr:NEL-type E3 ubiquitin ligase domain-containing protein [Pseudomonas entomophila]MBA1191324.1 hypothetical protein [Pseudomonas entomophila]